MNRKVYQLEAIGDTAHNWPKTRESTRRHSEALRHMLRFNCQDIGEKVTSKPTEA